jgi:hypothetical protein
VEYRGCRVAYESYGPDKTDWRKVQRLKANDRRGFRVPDTYLVKVRREEAARKREEDRKAAKTAMLTNTTSTVTPSPRTTREATPGKNRDGGVNGRGRAVKSKSGSVLYGADGHASGRRKAEDSDRADREAWAGRKFKSAYASMVALPDKVKPNDRAMAQTVLMRVRAAIDRGGWTRTENARLHRMEFDWELRATGKDPTFKRHGWSSNGKLGDTKDIFGWSAMANTIYEAEKRADKLKWERRVKRGF